MQLMNGERFNAKELAALQQFGARRSGVAGFDKISQPFVNWSTHSWRKSTVPAITPDRDVRDGIPGRAWT
jgi:hypothetical protein